MGNESALACARAASARSWVNTGAAPTCRRRRVRIAGWIRSTPDVHARLASSYEVFPFTPLKLGRQPPALIVLDSFATHLHLCTIRTYSA